MFGRKISQRDTVTDSASIAPTDTGKLMSAQKQQNALDLMTNTGELKAQPIRNPAHAFFNINSIDRYASSANPVSQYAMITKSPAQHASTPASNFNMSLQRNLLSGYFHRLTVSETNLQWQIPTINSQNYIFAMSSLGGGVPFTSQENIALNPGFYTYTELAAELQTQIIAAFTAGTHPIDSLTVTWSPNVANGSGYAFVFNTNDPTKQIGFNTSLVDESLLIPGQSIDQGNRALLKLYIMLGITSQVAVNNPIFFYNDIIYSNPSYPTLIYTSYIDIISSKLSQLMRVKDSETAFQPDTAVITRIYLSTTNGISAPILSQTGTTTFDTFAIGSRPFVLNYSPNTVKNINWSPGQSIIDFDIRVVDEFGDLVPWNLQTTSPTNNANTFTEFFEFQLTTLASES